MDVDSRETPGDFDANLRKVDGLRRDELLTEAEYEQKRSQLMRQRW